MHCLDAQPDLGAYVDGELSPERATFLEQHLAGCDECRAELARLRAVVDAMETWPLVPEPARLRARVMAQVRPRPTLPRFRVHWSDLAISLAQERIEKSLTSRKHSMLIEKSIEKIEALYEKPQSGQKIH